MKIEKSQSILLPEMEAITVASDISGGNTKILEFPRIVRIFAVSTSGSISDTFTIRYTRNLTRDANIRVFGGTPQALDGNSLSVFTANQSITDINIECKFVVVGLTSTGTNLKALTLYYAYIDNIRESIKS